MIERVSVIETTLLEMKQSDSGRLTIDVETHGRASLQSEKESKRYLQLFRTSLMEGEK